MEERFDRLYLTPKRLYAKGSPVIIMAGALLRDNQTGKLIAQIKFKNLSDKNIKALQIKVVSSGVTGEFISETEYQYLDLCAKRDDEFGQNTPVYLDNDDIRSFAVFIDKVMFEDGTWDYLNGFEWKEMPVAESMKDAFSNEDQLQGYRSMFGEKSENLPLEYEDLWICSCGGINHNEEEACHICKNSKIELFKFDRDEFLKKIEVLMKEKEYKEKQRKKKILMITAIVLASLVLVFGVYKLIYMPGQYHKAVKAMNAGEYETATEIFTSLADYKDSNSLIYECAEEAIDAYIEKGEYEKALEAYEASNLYNDDSYFAIMYGLGNQLIDEGKYVDGIDTLKKCIDYKDAKKKRRAAMYAYIQENIDAPTDKVKSYLKTLKKLDYKDTKEIYNELYAWEMEIVVNNDPDDAETDMKEIYGFDSLYFHLTLNGGDSSEGFVPQYVITFPDGQTKKEKMDDEFGSGSTGWLGFENGIYKDSYYGEGGKLTIKFYDDEDNLIGSKSVKILDYEDYMTEHDEYGEGYYIVTADPNLRIREKSNADSEVIGKLDKDEEVYIDEVMYGWGRVYMDESYVLDEYYDTHDDIPSYGWVSMEFLEYEDYGYLW